LKESKSYYESEIAADYHEVLFKRHFQGALVRSGASAIMWMFALTAFYADMITMNQFRGITFSVLCLILMNPPTLLLLNRITRVRLHRYLSILINFLEILGYTAIIYFMGGIEAAYITLIYAALIAYVGIVAPRRLPFEMAILCSAIFTIVVLAEHFGFIPHQKIIQSLDTSWSTQLFRLSAVIGFLFVIAYISSYASGLLKKNRDKLREQNLDLMEKAERLEKAEKELRAAHHDLEIRIEKRTAELAKANEDLVRELAERKRLELQLLQAEKMEAVGTLAGGIAHDFNNLLMGIQGYTSLMLLGLDTGHPHYEKLKHIEEQVRSGAELTQQLLGFARGGRYEIEPTNLNEMITKTSSMFGRTKKEITIHRRYDSNLWPVEVDRSQIEQVLMNLYVNAWQAMPGGGKLYMDTCNVHLDESRAKASSIIAGRYVKISITDTGVGMDERTKERIFEPFFTTKEMGRGTGLGLATVYGIIKGHKGVINVYSEKDHGTTFNIYLPATEKEAVKKKEYATGPLRGHETILLVDDEKTVREVSRELLERLGYRVISAGGGQEAVEIYRTDKDTIDLVILDMIMPGMSGSETFDRLRDMNSDIKVILSSGYSLNGQARSILDRGCQAFLQKPFTLQALSENLREVLERHA
jgi:signal transduction histidine kinase/CheY-like chemotaxis protein